MLQSFKKKNFNGVKLQRFISCPCYTPMADQLGALTARSKLMKQPRTETLPANVTEGKEDTRFSELAPESDTHRL